mmetsp:Transcript_66573/g.216649  ORF Transcript_66573/g.216649 Transcript_66573/m.216649 type:complete len:203 (-) Transcript_66573:437-1045(-)
MCGDEPLFDQGLYSSLRSLRRLSKKQLVRSTTGVRVGEAGGLGPQELPLGGALLGVHRCERRLPGVQQNGRGVSGGAQDAVPHAGVLVYLHLRCLADLHHGFRGEWLVVREPVAAPSGDGVQHCLHLCSRRLAGRQCGEVRGFGSRDRVFQRDHDGRYRHRDGEGTDAQRRRQSAGHQLCHCSLRPCHYHDSARRLQLGRGR